VRATTSHTVVVKLGGRSLEAPGALDELALGLASLPDAVLVHGGGNDVSAWSERLGLAPRFVDGLRVTDAATLDVATAVLAGLANKRLVARLRGQGIDAIGLAALDGVVETEPHPDAAVLGRVGRVTSVDASLLGALRSTGRVPVLSSIGSHRGDLLNLNADDLAAAIAGAIDASVLILLSDTPGVSIGGRVTPAIAAGELDDALDHPDVQGGMKAKLAAARAALAAGVGRVWIAAWQGQGTLAGLLAGAGQGTLVHAVSTHSSVAAPRALAG
jgi:acetylglutamate kinase